VPREEQATESMPRWFGLQLAAYNRANELLANMSLSCEQYYRQLHSSCGGVLAQSFEADKTSQHAAAHQFRADLTRWYEVLEGRPERDLILAALSEYQFALLAVVFGQYRQSFMSLRLSLELLLGCVHFSANELKLRLWMRGSQDIVWSSLIDKESGVFSKSFVRVFYEDLVDLSLQHGAIAEKVYRECSEYVHGNANTHSTLDGKVTFQEQAFQDWHQKAKAVRLASSFALCARYVQLLEPEKRVQLETILLDNLGHISAVRAILGAPVEQADV